MKISIKWVGRNGSRLKIREKKYTLYLSRHMNTKTNSNIFSLSIQDVNLTSFTFRNLESHLSAKSPVRLVIIALLLSNIS